MSDLDDLLNQLESSAAPVSTPSVEAESPKTSSSSSQSKSSSSSKKDGSSGHSKSSSGSKSSSSRKDGDKEGSSSSKSKSSSSSTPVVVQAQPVVAQPVPVQVQVQAQPVRTTSMNAKPIIVQPIHAQTMVIQPGQDFNSLMKSGVERNYNGLLNEGSTMMQDFGFKMLTETFQDEDQDNNTATDFKVSGNTSTIVGSPSILLLKGFNDQGMPTALNKPEKYVNVYYTHFSGVSVQPWYRENEDTTLAIGFFPTLVGDHTMKITLVGNDLFETNINVNPAGEENRWVTRLEMPQVNKKWNIDIVRTDGSKPEGKYAFEVESQGNVQNLNIEDLNGQYRVSCVPITPGPVKIHIRLQGQYINGSPVELIVPGAQPQMMMPMGGMGMGMGGGSPMMMQPMNAQPQQMQPMNSQPQQMRPMNAQPMQAQPMVMQSMNAQPMNAQPMKAQPMVMQPMNATPVQAVPMNAQPIKAQPMVMQPMNATPLNAQPMKATPVVAQPVKAQPMQAQSIKATPMNAQPIKATPIQAKPITQDKGASDALADLLADLEST